MISVSRTTSSQLYNSAHLSVDNAVIQCLPSGYHFPTHLHHTIELFTCLTGDVTVTILGSEVVVKPGEYFVYFPDVPHSIRITSPEECSFIQIHFHNHLDTGGMSGHLLSDESAFAFELSMGRRKYMKGICHPQLEACMRGIYEEVRGESSDSHTMIQLYVSQLSILLSREIIADRTMGSIHQNRYLINASVFINENYMKKLSVQEVADAAGISTRYLTKLFHENFDMGVSAYIAHVRVSKAIDFMYSNPNYPLTKLSLDVGFSSQQHFSKVFKEKMTVSPKRYFSLQLNNT